MGSTTVRTLNTNMLPGGSPDPDIGLVFSVFRNHGYQSQTLTVTVVRPKIQRWPLAATLEQMTPRFLVTEQVTQIGMAPAVTWLWMSIWPVVDT